MLWHTARSRTGCWFPDADLRLRAPERITANKEFCDCTFRWRFSDGDAHGVSLGKTLPAIPTDVKTVYPRQALTAQNAAALPCTQVLGSYVVRFERPQPTP